MVLSLLELNAIPSYHPLKLSLPLVTAVFMSKTAALLNSVDEQNAPGITSRILGTTIEGFSIFDLWPLLADHRKIFKARQFERKYLMFVIQLQLEQLLIIGGGDR